MRKSPKASALPALTGGTLRSPGAEHNPGEGPHIRPLFGFPSGLSCLIWAERRMHLRVTEQASSQHEQEKVHARVPRLCSEARPRPSRDLARVLPGSLPGEGPGHCPAALAWAQHCPVCSLGLQALSPPTVSTLRSPTAGGAEPDSGDVRAQDRDPVGRACRCPCGTRTSASAETGCAAKHGRTHSAARRLVSRAGSGRGDTQLCPGDKSREGHVFRSQRN